MTMPKTGGGGAWDHVFTPRTTGERRYWLVKSEPDVFSFDDLMAAPKRTTQWNGVRNFVARNFLRDGMRTGDQVLYYHTGDEKAVVGICEVVREAYPDDTALDPKHEGFDPKSTRDKPTWYMVDLRGIKALAKPVTLAEIRKRKDLANMPLIRIGRLSVQPVSEAEWETIAGMAGGEGTREQGTGKVQMREGGTGKG